MFENVNLGTTIVRVSAADADSGLFSVIEYSLVDGEGKFGIKPSTVSYCVTLASTPRLIRLGNCTVNKAFKCAKRGFTLLTLRDACLATNDCLGASRAAPLPATLTLPS